MLNKKLTGRPVAGKEVRWESQTENGRKKEGGVTRHYSQPGTQEARHAS